MKTADFDYPVPSHLIAQVPVEPRDASRLMVIVRGTGTIEHRYFRDIVDYLKAGDLLVANDSRVMAARLVGRKTATGGRVEILVTAQHDGLLWEALHRGRRVREGTQLEFVKGGLRLGATVEGFTSQGAMLLRFEAPIRLHLRELGLVPLPPYIHEPLRDGERYQTVYAREEGSVAAPTAGLHFTAELMERVREKGVEVEFVTLHIGPDTFRPVRTEEVEDHHLAAEYCELSPQVAEAVLQATGRGRVIAVGTTSVRVLETACQKDGRVAPYRGWTDLFIRPGYRFQAVEALITNFHMPRSTLLVLVAAFAGKELMDRAYNEAIERNYRFYSFGDAMLIL